LPVSRRTHCHVSAICFEMPLRLVAGIDGLVRCPSARPVARHRLSSAVKAFHRVGKKLDIVRISGSGFVFSRTR
jgi:hypothetical protein